MIKLYPQETILLAEKQTQGRGQFGRKWLSPAGNLHFSFKTRQTRFAHLKKSLLSKSFFVALVRAIEAYKKNFTLQNSCKQELFFKEPNDLLNQENKKLGGILLEKKNSDLIVGIGVNFCELENTSLQNWAFFDWGAKKNLKKIALYLAKAIYDLEQVSNREILDFTKAYARK